MLVTWGAGMVKTTLVLLPTPPSVTLTGPLIAAVGTVATICASLQLFTVALVPLKVMVLVPCVAPKLLPLICTWVPTGPESGVRLIIVGFAARRVIGRIKLTARKMPNIVEYTDRLIAPLLHTHTSPEYRDRRNTRDNDSRTQQSTCLELHK